MKQKLKSYTFWVALVSAIILVVEEICKLFGWGVDVGIIENVLLSICSVFVVLGIITKADKKTVTDTEKINDEKQLDDVQDCVDEILNLDIDSKDKE